MALVPGIFGFGGTRETKPELKLVPVRDIKANPPGRFRIDPAAVVRLAESIRVQGLIEPLLVRPFSGKYELVIGFRRLVAAVMAGMTAVPAVVVKLDAEEAGLARLNHVLHHEPLGPVDAAEEMAAAAARYRLGAEELGIEVGMGGAWAKERLEVLNLREEIREMVRDGRLTERHARALLGIEDGDRALQVAAELAAGDIGMAEAEEMIREMGRGVPASSAPGSGRSSRRRMLRVVKDLRIFLNSFRSAVETLRQGGIAATMTEDDHGNEIEIRVVIPAEPGIGGLKASSEIAGANP